MPFWGWIIVAVILVFAGVGIAWWRRQLQRRLHYAELARKRQGVVREDLIGLNSHADLQTLAATFRGELLLRVTNFVTPETLQRLRNEALANLSRGLRSYIPVHKKGRSLPYEFIHEHAPTCLSFYHSRAVQEWVSAVVGVKVHPALDHDQSALSILFYDQPGDHIQWHYDHNYYHGRQFTVLLSLVNQSGSGAGLSAGTLQRRSGDGTEVSIPTEENTLIIFEGARVVHRVTPTAPGDLRIMLSMTYNTDPRIRPIMELARRIKDTAFHGIKAVWD